MRITLFLILFFFTVKGTAQRIVTFPSEDDLIVTADLYFQDKGLPFIILCHQANSSRGEYKETALKFEKLGYNCLAIDLRSGKEINYVQNETAARAAEMKIPVSYLDAEKDICAAIEYVKKISNRKIILCGSSYSASLVMKVGNKNPDILAVIAFSPGEYFQPKMILRNFLNDYEKPVFVAATATEKLFVQELISDIPAENLVFFTPKQGEGIHGSKALWEIYAESEEVWLSLLLFFKKITL